MRSAIIIFFILVIATGILVNSANLSNGELTVYGFYLSLIGFFVSVGGTIFSGLSFVNAKEAKIAATAAKNQFSKGKQNIELAELSKQGKEVREKAQKLLDKNCTNREDILLEIDRFAFKCEDMSSLINVTGYGFSTRPSLIRTEVNKYRKEIETPGTFIPQNIVSKINDDITKILQIITEQISKNID